MKGNSKYSRIQNGWSKEELDYLKANLDTPVKELVKNLPNRTLAAIAVKKQVLRGRRTTAGYPKIKIDSNRWTQLEKNCIADNLDKRAKWFLKHPMFIDGKRSLQSIACRLSEMKKKAKKLTGTE